MLDWTHKKTDSEQREKLRYDAVNFDHLGVKPSLSSATSWLYDVGQLVRLSIIYEWGW